MASIPATCPRCGTALVPGANFCQGCGGAVATAVPGSAPPPMGQTPLASATFGAPPPVYGAPTPYAPLPPGVVFIPSTIVRDRDRTVTGLLLLVIGIALSWIPYVDIIGGLIALIGIIMVFMGRRAFGPEHHRDVLAGGVLFLISILATIGLTIGLVAALLSAATVSTTGTVTLNGSMLQGDLQVFFIGAAVVGIIGGLSRVILVYALSDRTSRILLWAGFFLSVAISIVVLLVLYPQIVSAVNSATSGTTYNNGPISSLTTEADLLGAINVLPALLFAWAYWRAREEALRRTTAPPTY